MIKVNLYPGKKPTNLTKFAGFDLLKINKIMALVAVLIWIFPEDYAKDYFREEKEKIEAVHKQLDSENSSLNKKLLESKKLETQVNALKDQEQKLANKLSLIKKIFEEKRNPFGLMLYIAKNVPKDVWITNLKIEADDLNIEGESYNYSQIGTFIENLKNSIYLRGEIDFRQPQGGETVDGIKTERFIIRSKIGKFE